MNMNEIKKEMYTVMKIPWANLAKCGAVRPEATVDRPHTHSGISEVVSGDLHVKNGRWAPMDPKKMRGK
jgi:hypothetical protein